MSYFIEQLLNGIFMGGAYGLVALGFTLIFGIMKVLNIAHGETLMVAPLITALCITALQWPAAVAVGAGVGASVLLSLLMERLVLRPLLNPQRAAAHLAPLLATFGVSMLLANAAALWTTSVRQPFPVQFRFSLWEVGGVFISPKHLLTFIIAIAMMLALKLWIDRTRLGKAIRASAENPEVAGTLGVNARGVILLTMVLSGTLGGVGGLLLATQFASFSAFMGLTFGLKGLIVMIVGGVGSLTGAMVAGIMLGVVESMTVAYISSQFAPVVAFGLLIVVLLVRPSGLFGVAVRTR